MIRIVLQESMGLGAMQAKSFVVLKNKNSAGSGGSPVYHQYALSGKSAESGRNFRRRCIEVVELRPSKPDIDPDC